MQPKAMKLLPLAAALFGLASSSAMALEFHGYLRSGVGSNSKDGSQVCFQLPGAYAKYRLGNECENYAELAFDHELFSAKDGVSFTYHGMLAYVSNQQQDYESLKGDGRDIALRQNWIEVKNLDFLNGGTLWAGKRYYERQDVHINDFFYWDTSGYGGGVQNVNAGPVKLSYALMRNTSSQTNATTRHDFRVGGINTNPGGDLTVGVQFNRADSSESGKQNNGDSITLQHFQGNFLGGYNKFAIQYFKGSASNGSLAYPDNGTPDDKKTWRIVESLQWQMGKDFTGMGTIVYQDKKDDYKWTSFGVRPVWHFSDYVKLQFEYGHDEVKPVGQTARKLDKFTIAPTVVAGRGFWARPELRAFVTFAKWNDEARDQWGGVAGGVGGVFGSATSGRTIGLQAEAWW